MSELEDITTYQNKIKMLEVEITTLKQTIDELKCKLKKYTNNESHKKYYEQNKETVKIKAKQYTEKIKSENPDKMKQWRHTAYMNRKNKNPTDKTQSD